MEREQPNHKMLCSPCNLQPEDQRASHALGLAEKVRDLESHGIATVMSQGARFARDLQLSQLDHCDQSRSTDMSDITTSRNAGVAFFLTCQECRRYPKLMPCASYVLLSCP